MDRREFLLKLGRSTLLIGAVALSGRLFSGRGGLFGAASNGESASGGANRAVGTDASGRRPGVSGTAGSAATVDCPPAWNCGGCVSLNNCGLPKRKQYASLTGR